MNDLARRAGTALAATTAALALTIPAAAAHTAPGTVSDNCDVPWINCTEGVENCSAADNHRVYYNSGYGGTSQYIGTAGRGCNWVNLISALKNENASQHFA